MSSFSRLLMKLKHLSTLLVMCVLTSFMEGGEPHHLKSQASFLFILITRLYKWGQVGQGTGASIEAANFSNLCFWNRKFPWNSHCFLGVQRILATVTLSAALSQFLINASEHMGVSIWRKNSLWDILFNFIHFPPTVNYSSVHSDSHTDSRAGDPKTQLSSFYAVSFKLSPSPTLHSSCKRGQVKELGLCWGS